MKKKLSDLKFLLLLPLAVLMSCQSSKTNSLTVEQITRLYSLPPSVLLAKGTVLHTTTGDVVLTSEQRVYSEGAYKEQVERAIRSTP